MKRLLTALLFVLLCFPGAVLGAEPQRNNLSYEFTILPAAGPDKARLELFLVNRGNTPFLFEFPTSQKYEIVITDSSNQEVYRFSAGKAFTQAIQTLNIKPKETVTWTEEWDYLSGGKRVKEGEYKVEAVLKARTVNGQAVTGAKAQQASIVIPGINPVFSPHNGSQDRYR